MKKPLIQPIISETDPKQMRSQVNTQSFNQDLQQIESLNLSKNPLNIHLRFLQPLNTLLLAKPKWREFNKQKWQSKKDFNAQKTSRDKTWDHLPNTSQNYNEPYLEGGIKFRSSQIQQQNLDLNTNLSKQGSIIRGYSQGQKGTQMFDSTVANDKTWKNRVMESSSLRQRDHLNQTLKIKELSPKAESNSFYTNPMIKSTSGGKISNQQLEDPEVNSTSATPEKKVIRFLNFQNQQKDSKYKELEQILSESSPIERKEVFMVNQVKVREKIIDLSQIQPDDAANFLNNNFNKSFTNSWQYQIMKPLENKRFSIKEELNESHILGKLDKVKTYYGSLAGKIPLQKFRSHLSTPKNNQNQQTPVQDKNNRLDNVIVNLENRFQIKSENKNDRMGFRKQTARTQMNSSISSSLSDKMGGETSQHPKDKERQVKDVIKKYFEKIQDKSGISNKDARD